MAHTTPAYKTNCFICGRQISSSGLGYTSHMRYHVRRGEATELRLDDFSLSFHAVPRNRVPIQTSRLINQ